MWRITCCFFSLNADAAVVVAAAIMKFIFFFFSFELLIFIA